MVKFLTVSDLAKRWGKTRKTIERWRKAGILPRPHAQLGWSASQIEEFEAKRADD